MVLLLLFFIPMLEVYLVFKAGEIYGAMNVVFYLIWMSTIGYLLMRRFGQNFMRSTQNSLQQGKMPEEVLMHQTLKFFGAFLIFLPGFISDIVGLTLLLPGTRHLWMKFLKNKLKAQLANQGPGGFRIFTFGTGPFSGQRPYRPTPEDFPNLKDIIQDHESRVERDAEVIDIKAIISERQEKKDKKD